MDYIDLDGKKIINETSQDRLLKFLYTNLLGRMLLKPLINPKLSEAAGKVLSTRLSACIIKKFVAHNKINLKDYPRKRYKSFNDFFTRKIKPGARPIDVTKDALISPCDCKATIHPINDNSIFSIKNTEYTLRSLLRSPSLAEEFKGGYAYLLRLTVDDYHRYIYAVSGKKSKQYKIKGTFHTVNPVANDYLPIYKENSREYCLISSNEYDKIIQMEVGALMVGKITNHNKAANSNVVKGQEKGYFEFGGSTIILLTKKGTFVPRNDILQNTQNGYETILHQGQLIGLCNSPRD